MSSRKTLRMKLVIGLPVGMLAREARLRMKRGGLVSRPSTALSRDSGSAPRVERSWTLPRICKPKVFGGLRRENFSAELIVALGGRVYVDAIVRPLPRNENVQHWTSQSM